MGDLLSSASLLLTLIALLYSLWYPEINQALDVKVKSHAADRVKDHEQVRRVYLSKAIPLTVVAAALTIVFSPEFFKIVFQSFINLTQKRRLSVLDYDASSASFLLVIFGSALFSVHLFSLCRKLRAHITRLNPNPNSRE
jgi:hypothetical protein